MEYRVKVCVLIQENQLERLTAVRVRLERPGAQPVTGRVLLEWVEAMREAEVVITDSLDSVANALRADVPVVYMGLGFAEGAMVRTESSSEEHCLEAVVQVMELKKALMVRPSDWGPRSRFSVQVRH